MWVCTSTGALQLADVHLCAPGDECSFETRARVLCTYQVVFEIGFKYRPAGASVCAWKRWASECE